MVEFIYPSKVGNSYIEQNGMGLVCCELISVIAMAEAKIQCATDLFLCFWSQGGGVFNPAG
jgi:hypothetical protein